MINHSDVMKKAWRLYRIELRFGGGQSFGDMLKHAWFEAKQAAAIAGPHAKRIHTISHAILTLDCKSSRYSIAGERRALTAKLQGLSQAA